MINKNERSSATSLPADANIMSKTAAIPNSGQDWIN